MAATSSGSRTLPLVSQPEPGLTPDDMIARAVALRPKLIERQAAVEQRTYYDEDMHQEFLRAGFYRMYVPRRYGGYEFDVPTFLRVAVELARGCPSTAWCLSLAANHALMVGSWFPQQAQDEIFGNGDFRAASVAAPVGVATRVAGGWELSGKISYCSGIPYSNHYLGQALLPDADPAGGPASMLLFVAPRSEFTMLDDWGDLLGLKGSGSQSITFDRGFIPHHWALEGASMVDLDVSDGTPGVALHGNPLYGGRALGIFTLSLAAVLVGAAYNALDEYENHLHSKQTPMPPMVPRSHDPDYQRYFGSAMAKIATAEAAMTNCAEQHMQLCRRAVEEGIPYSYEDDMRIGCIAREVMVQTWEIMQAEIWRTAGSSASRAGERLERIYRDMSMGNSHRNVLLRDWAFRELARTHLGIPRDTGNANVQPVGNQNR